MFDEECTDMWPEEMMDEGEWAEIKELIAEAREEIWAQDSSTDR